MLTVYNTTGYSQEQLDTLNEEFYERYQSGEWEGLSEAEAQQAFGDEIAKR